VEYVSEYIKAVVAGIEAMGSGFEPKLVSKPLAELMQTTLDTASLSSKLSRVYVANVGTGELTSVETGELSWSTSGQLSTVGTSANDVTMQMVAYLLAAVPKQSEQEITLPELLVRLVSHISGQRWGLYYAHPASVVESADLHGLSKGFKPDTSSWRLGVSVLAHASYLYGGDQADEKLTLWAITWEQKLRMGNMPQRHRTQEQKKPDEVRGIRYSITEEELLEMNNANNASD